MINEPITEMTKYDQDFLSPEEYLKLPPHRRKDILSVKPFVRRFGSSSLSDTDFVTLAVRWKTPHYKIRL